MEDIVESRGDRELERRACLDMFIERFGVDAPLVSVPKLARLLGKSKSWIYGQIKAGSFFLPWRMVCGAPLIPVDALIDWYLGEVPVAKAPRARRPDAGPASQDGEEGPMLGSLASVKDKDVDRWVSNAMQTIEAGHRGRPGEGLD